VGYCAPVLVPYLFGEGKTTGDNFVTLALFLSGRLFGYLIFAVMAWGVGGSLMGAGRAKELTIGSTYVILSILLMIYAYLEVHPACPTRLTRSVNRVVTTYPFLLPAAIGLATGMNFCPLFLLAITGGGVFTLTPYSPSVLSVQYSYKLKDGWAVRVRLKNDLKGKS